MADLVADLGVTCDRRSKELLKAIEALEEIQTILIKSRKPIEKERLLWICQKSLDQIDMIEENGGHHG